MCIATSPDNFVVCLACIEFLGLGNAAFLGEVVNKGEHPRVAHI